MSETMDRGTDALQSHLSDCATMAGHQTTRPFSCDDLCGCEAPSTEFKYFNPSSTQIAHSHTLVNSNFCLNLWGVDPALHPFTTQVKDLKTDAEMLTVERPCACPVCCCKCCCFQQAAVTSGNQPMGSIKEDCYWFVPQFTLSDGKGNAIYNLHQPTCCYGCCINGFTEGNPCCGLGLDAFHVYPADQVETGGDAPYVGKILTKDRTAFEVTFPKGATTDKKALLVGTSIFLNASSLKKPPPTPADAAKASAGVIALQVAGTLVGTL